MAKPKKHSSNKALTVRSNVKFGKAIGVIATLVVAYVFFSFAFVVGAPIVQALLPPALEALRSQDWPEVPCTIVKSELSANPPFELELCYSFEIEQQHENCQYSIKEARATGPKAELEKLAQQYPVGQKTVCYVDPDDPGNAILVKTPKWIAWRDIAVIAVPALILFLGVVAVIRSISRRFHPPKTTEQSDSSTPNLSHNLNVQNILKLKQSKWSPDFTTIDDGTPVELKSENQFRGCGAIFLGIFTTIWLSISGVVISKRIGDWNQGVFQGADFVVAFLAFIGFILICGLIYLVLSLFNPVAKVTLSRRHIPLGESGTVSWEFERSAHSIAELTLSLKAVEYVRYTVGTNTSVEEKAFYEEILFETNEPTAIANGEVTVKIPGNLMHSFEGLNNKIIWRIQIKGRISNWPDVNQTFKLEVPPHRSF